MSGEKNNNLPVITRREFKGISMRPGFSSTSKGCYEYFAERMEEAVREVTCQAVIQAEFEGRRKLVAKDAQVGLKNTPYIPETFH